MSRRTRSPQGEVSMSQKPRKYYIAVGLLYPAALGAGLAWLVPAVPAAVTSHGQAPTWWIVLFAAALRLAVSARVGRGLRHMFPHGPVAWFLFLLARGLSVVGILPSREGSNTLVSSDWCLLLGLYILLGIYLVYPAAFESLLA